MTYLPTCTFLGDREDLLIDYLYGERGSPGARAFADHLTTCLICQTEMDELGGVRRALDAWSPPEPLRALTPEPVGRPAAFPRHTKSDAEISRGAKHAVVLPSHWAVPVWARAAAVVACVGIGLGAANLRVSYGADGVSVQTGWLQSPQDARSAAPTATRSTLTPRIDSAPWRAELAALEEQLRSEMHQTPIAMPASAPGTDAILQKMKALVSQSEQRQQRELALRLGDLRNDVHAQRLADLSRIERSIGVVQNSTGMEVLRQREMLNSLAVRVSQRQ